MLRSIAAQSARPSRTARVVCTWRLRHPLSHSPDPLHPHIHTHTHRSTNTRPASHQPREGGTMVKLYGGEQPPPGPGPAAWRYEVDLINTNEFISRKVLHARSKRPGSSCSRRRGLTQPFFTHSLSGEARPPRGRRHGVRLPGPGAAGERISEWGGREDVWQGEGSINHAPRVSRRLANTRTHSYTQKSHVHSLTRTPPPSLSPTHTYKNKKTQNKITHHQEKGAPICVDERCLNRATFTECLKCSKTACANQRLRCVRACVRLCLCLCSMSMCRHAMGKDECGRSRRKEGRTTRTSSGLSLFFR